MKKPDESAFTVTTRRRFMKDCSTAALLLTAFDSSVSFAASETSDGLAAPVGSSVIPAPTATVSEETGKPYVGWQEGEMDLHFIYTGVGESGFHILPDGTSLLIDAGDRDTAKYAKNAVVLPDRSRHSGEWVARYIQRVNPAGNHVDYMMASHFHDDHCGGELFYAAKTEGRGEDYFLGGLTQTAEFLKIDTVIDRGFPDFAQPQPIKCHEEKNWRKFLRWQEANNGLKPLEFLPGRADQIVLKKNPGKFKGAFQVRNICRNGVVCQDAPNPDWEFQPETVVPTVNLIEKYPNNKQRYINENALSLGLRISYGPFRFFTGGDISGRIVNEQNQDINLDAWVGKAVGKVNVCKANHHSYLDAMRAEFVKEVQAQAYIINVWDQLHIQDNTMTNMASEELYSGERIICPTNYPPERLDMYRDKFWQKRVVKQGGHVVIKVLDAGRKFKIYYLTANNESMMVKAVYGPYYSQR